MCPISRHGICRCHSTQSNRSFISTFISHYAHRLYRQQDNSCLPYFIIQSPVTQSLDEDIVSILQNTYFFRSNISQNTHCQSRSRKRMTGNQMLRHTQLTAHPANFILKQQTKRLTQLQIHLFRKSPYIMMALYYRTRNRQ